MDLFIKNTLFLFKIYNNINFFLRFDFKSQK